MTLTGSVTRRLLAAAASVLVALTLTLGATGARAEDSDGIAAAPAADGGVDQSRSRYSYQVEPGQQVADEYLVENTGTTVQSVTVYATDAFNAEDGSFALLDGGAPSTGAGHWVTFEGAATQIQLTLQPGASQVVPFTMTTPADAGPGDHAGGILVSALSPAGEVSVDRRVAIRLYVRVKGLLQPGLTISSIATSYRSELNPFSGELTATISLSNTGNVALAANTVAQVRGLFGIPLSGLTDVMVPEMLPGSHRTVTITVPGVGPWVYLVPHISLAATVEPGALDAGVLPAAERDATLFVVPWGILLVLLLAGLAWPLARLRRRRNATRAQAWVEYTEAEARRKAIEDAPAETETAGMPVH